MSESIFEYWTSRALRFTTTRGSATASCRSSRAGFTSPQCHGSLSPSATSPSDFRCSSLVIRSGGDDNDDDDEDDSLVISCCGYVCCLFERMKVWWSNVITMWRAVLMYETHSTKIVQNFLNWMKFFIQQCLHITSVKYSDGFITFCLFSTIWTDGWIFRCGFILFLVPQSLFFVCSVSDCLYLILNGLYWELPLTFLQNSIRHEWVVLHVLQHIFSNK